MPAYEFVKSSYSGGNSGQECVEVARNVPGVVAVRDSKQTAGGVLVVASAAWHAFRCSLGQAAVD
ncbi:MULTISPECIES: DUF397 domain-containing protein [unclassified Streptomyces]|uniref:DUF397 domain-containing protein n=1 Tax=unclassified Streptomyces TaxID=2593676 RepID=UPI000DAC1DBE|nr:MULTISPECIES: DUF397 domain-containing protein [unclassified Streptomyces]PZT72796.1 DUF397 domain-containing protein [Streptomyces sp. AC1-42T]PZT80886.1 DUF397 domain-containing protein [Streptomyces sp. AC1-42W]